MADTGALSPTSTGSNAYGEGGTAAWSNTSNITSSDDSRASVTLTGSFTTTDSYTTAGATGFTIHSGAYSRRGQSFTNTNLFRIERVDFNFWKFGSPTGNAVVKVYAHTGTFGSSGLPTGSPLATSDNLDVSTLTGSPTTKTFTFSGANQIVLEASTAYFLIVEYTSGDSSNYIALENDNGALSHAGNSTRSTDGSSWLASSPDRDFPFWAYGTTFVTSEYLIGFDCGFSIPASAIINGVKVEIEQQQGTSTQAREVGIKLIEPGVGLFATNKSTGAVLPSSDTYITYGGASDVWGLTLTPTIINDADFGAVFSITAPSGVPIVDHFRITVYYTLPSGGAFFQMF